MKRLAALAAGISVGVFGWATAPAAVHKPRPTLTLSGTVLHWTPLSGATAYQIIARPGDHRITVVGTEAQAPRFPGVAETYRVRERMPVASAESNGVTIDWAAVEAAELEAKQHKEAEEQTAREKAEREAELEAKQHKEAEEQAAREKAEREAKESAEKAQQEREAKEKAELEAKQHKEAEEQAAREKAEREAKEKEGTCTTTVSSASAVAAAAGKGGTVCLTAGTYGPITLNVTPPSQATVTAVPGAHVVTGGITISASNLTVSQLHVVGSLNIASGNNTRLEHNEVSGGGYGISILATGAVVKNTTIAWNRIHDTSHTSEGDALRFDGWETVQVSGNDIYKIAECPGNTCHTDTLQSYQAGVETRGLTINRNYVHDNTNVQGLPFLKDGDVQNVSITDNLMVRDSATQQVSGFWVDDNTKALIVENNTYLTGSALASNGSASSPSAKVEHNVLTEFNLSAGGVGYALTEDFNTYTGNNEWSFKLGPHDTKGTPAFTNPATDNYIVPGGQGVDWQPSQYQYGPTW